MPIPHSNYCSPIASVKFFVTQPFFAIDPVNYPITGHHPGVDYGTQGDMNIPLFFCADGEVIESILNHPVFGNCFFFYAPGPDRTFVYFHLRDTSPPLGAYKCGIQAGIAGQTGQAQGIHLHFECIRGRVDSVKRSQLFTSAANLQAYAQDGDAFIRARLH